MEIVRFKILEDSNIETYFTSLHYSIHKLNQLLNLKLVKVNNRIASIDSELTKGDIVSLDITSFEEIDYLVEFDKQIELKVVYQDDYLLIVDKPKGYKIYSDNPKDYTMANIVRNYYNIKGINRKIRHCHRLDVECSGLLMYALDPIVHASISYMIEHKEIKRTYLAKVEGKVKKSGIINYNIGKDRHENKMICLNDGGKKAVTHYELVKYDQDSNTSTVLVNLLESGRTHQIRVHMAKIGHPLVGDTIYGLKKNKDEELNLQSYKLEFSHPITKEKMIITLDNRN